MEEKKIRVLFVCMGNICRSPAGEGIMKKLIQDAKLESRILIDSAGTIGYHEGELPDPRMREHGKRRGYLFDTRAREFIAKDYDRFDYILCADKNNLRDVHALAPNSDLQKKAILMTTFASEHAEAEVPDPYYGGPSGFDLVIDLLEDSCQGLLAKLKGQLNEN